MKVGLRLDQQACDRPDEADSAPNAAVTASAVDAEARAHRRTARLYGGALMLTSGLVTVLLLALLWYLAHRLL